MQSSNTYKGYKIVGLFPQFDIWAFNPDSTDQNGDAFDELVEEWDRSGEPEEIQIWTYNAEDQYWAWEGDFEGLEYQTVNEAIVAIDKFVEAK